MSALLLLAALTPAAKPNVVFFLVDDLGWADVGVNGSTFYETPNIDRLAAGGVNFTQAYAACPVCSPTRASILTGRHPVRVDVTDWIPGATRSKKQGARFHHVADRDNLALEEVTTAELLRDAGYDTFFAGKWHLGSGPGDPRHDGGQTFLPTDQGFRVNVGGGERGSPYGGYYAPWTNPRLPEGGQGEDLTTHLTDRTVEYIEDSGGKPFFAYLCFYNVHTPIQPYKPRLPHYEAKAGKFTTETPVIEEHDAVSRGRQDNPEYATMVEAVDTAVGRVLDTLDAKGIAEETHVYFFSDNGGLCTSRRIGPTSNLPLRSGKGWLYEGGVREPCIVRAPGVGEPGATCEEVVFSTDFAPTILSLCGLTARPDLHLDGRDISGLIADPRKDVAARTVYWHYPHYHGSTWTPGAAVRDGDWKLIEFYETDAVELYNLAADPGEQHDLSKLEPGKRDQLRGKLASWQREMGATMPEPFE